MAAVLPEYRADASTDAEFIRYGKDLTTKPRPEEADSSG
jgi:hypothetical protein